jgi:nucleotide-binding universal stress UspA family protein
MDPRSILVPLDGSAVSESALSVAERFAGRGGARLILVRAAEAPEDLGHVVAARLDAMRAAESYLDATAAELSAKGLEDVEKIARYGPAAEVILDTARTREHDLIVMATRGRRGLGRLMFGSVTESVVRGASTPVLVVRGDSRTERAKNQRASTRASEPVRA